LGRTWTMMVHMRRTSLVHAKAHLSELVDEAEHKKKPVIILRHGKPAAAIVPVDAVPGMKRATPRAMSADEAHAFMDELIARVPTSDMTIEEALGRDRLDRFSSP
jgi:prevent-host-death family protein